MSEIHDDLMAVLDAVEIQSPSRFSVLGATRDLESVATGSEASSSALAAELYERLYTRPSAGPGPVAGDILVRREFLAALSAANAGRGTWEAGWTVRRRADDGRIHVARGPVAYWTRDAGVRVDGVAIVAGASCRVFVPKERRGEMPGFYVADGDAGQAVDAGGVFLRYYWHLRAEAASPFLSAATTLLNGAGVAFRIKLLGYPAAYRRADAGVLYLGRDDQARAEPIIAAIRARVAPGLRAEVPLFTDRVAHGLGLAEDPSTGMSFGQHRCHLVARALWESFGLGEADRERRARAIAGAFRREGLDPSRPHLGPRPGPRPDPRPWAVPIAAAPETVDPAPIATIEAAARIGRSLCRAAYWDRPGGLCNWMGRSGDGPSEDDGLVAPTVSALGPGFYDGSAGVALFLARLAALTGDEEMRATATGAIRRSIRQLDRPTRAAPTPPLSFHQGPLGVAFVAREVAALTGDAALEAEASTILDQLFGAPGAPRHLDVIDGHAGAIPALLAMRQDPCRTLAVGLGEELCRRAIRRDGTCAWLDERTEPGTTARPLTGLAHGAAGIGLALFELYAATGREDFREMARGAFAYEDALFDPGRGNWPDLRADEPAAFAVAWCHGAPGIALARLRAARLDPARGDDYLRAARVAVATTLEAIERRIEHPRADATPCHGLAGLIEIVATAGRFLDEPSWSARAVAAAEILIARHSAPDDWPSGAPSGGPNPSLMIGNAGIGHTFLRLHDPEHVPPILWIAITTTPEIPRTRDGAGG